MNSSRCHSVADASSRRALPATPVSVSAEYNRLCRELEDAVLTLLGRKFAVETGFDIKVRRKSKDGPKQLRSYQLDFVLRDGADVRLIGELKLSSNPKLALSHARKQLRERIRWASLGCPGVKGLALCYHLPYEESSPVPRATADHDALGEILRSACLRPDGLSSYVVASDKLFKELAETGLATPDMFERMKEARWGMPRAPASPRRSESHEKMPLSRLASGHGAMPRCPFVFVREQP